MKAKTDTLESKLAALVAELADIDAKLADVERMKTRRRALVGEWRSTGEIEEAKRAIRDAEFPIYGKGNWPNTFRRIIAVDDKWIAIRVDGHDAADVVKFRRKDGKEARSQKYGHAIDVERALGIWSAHVATAQAPVGAEGVGR